MYPLNNIWNINIYNIYLQREKEKREKEKERERGEKERYYFTYRKLTVVKLKKNIAWRKADHVN